MVQRAHKTIEGKVAKILNNRELVINRGSNDGVEFGMKFKIVEENEEILDPDTQESLGSIVREKIRVKIVHVQPSLSIGQTFETYRESTPSHFGSLFLGLGSSETVTKVRTLSSSATTATDEKYATVRTGEKVVQVDENEETPVKQSDNS